MTALCPILRPSFEDYRNDTLPAPQRRILRDHLAACDECRALATAGDATMLFARPFAEEELPAAESQRILANVRTAVAFAETEKRLRRTVRRRRQVAASVAAAAAFGALLLTAPDRRDRSAENLAVSRPTPAADAPSSPLHAPELVSDAERASGEPAGSLPLASAATVSVPTDAEGISTDATVYEWSPGAGREEPRVVWIVDRGLDI